jgi:histidinol-phosphate aminotransferase
MTSGWSWQRNSTSKSTTTVPYTNWRYDLRAIAQQITDHTKIIYLANPNNPTGTIFTKEEFDEFYKHVPERVLIILDEAYYEYAKANPMYPDSMDYRYDNVITLRTFSKVYGLAGIRIGYGFAHDELIRNLLKVKLPFEPSVLAQAAGLGALQDEEFLQKSLEINAIGRKFLTENLRQLDLHVIPSDANFVMVAMESQKDAEHLYQELLKKGIIIRPLHAFGLPHCVRISVGTETENDIFIECLRKVLANALV